MQSTNLNNLARIKIIEDKVMLSSNIIEMLSGNEELYDHMENDI